MIASLVPRKLLIFPLNFGLSYFVLVLVFYLSASELASASLLLPTIFLVWLGVIFMSGFLFLPCIFACKKSFACCCCNFFHPRYFVYRSLSKIQIDVKRRRMFLRPGPATNSTALIPTAGFAFILCQANYHPLQTYLSEVPHPSVRVFHEASSAAAQ